MIKDKRMTFIKSENGINYYVFKPSIFSLYYKDKIKHSEEPPHRYYLTHRLHMLWHMMSRGGGV